MGFRAARASLILNVVSRSMARTEARNVLADIEAGRTAPALLFWIPLMKGAGGSDMIQQWRRLADARFPTRARSDLKTVAMTFAELAGRKEVWVEGLRDWTMVESTLLKEWTAKAEARTRREDLSLVLRERFPTAAIDDLLARIDLESDSATLRSWIKVAIKAKTITKVRAAILA
jgi:hypothetical protein